MTITVNIGQAIETNAAGHALKNCLIVERWENRDFSKWSSTNGALGQDLIFGQAYARNGRTGLLLGGFGHYVKADDTIIGQSGDRRIVVTSWDVAVGTIVPTANTYLCSFTTYLGSNVARLYYEPISKHIFIDAFGTTAVDTGVTMNQFEWHRIDIKFDVSSSTYHLNVTIDGGSNIQANSTTGQTPTFCIEFLLGSSVAGNGNMQIDNVYLSTDPAAYPIGSQYVDALEDYQSAFVDEVPTAPNSNDNTIYTLCTRITPTVKGQAVCGRWWVPITLPTNDPIIVLWRRTDDSTYTELARTTVLKANLVANSWNDFFFAAPPVVSANDDLTIGIFTQDRYSATGGFLTSDIVHRKMKIPADSSTAHNGRFRTGSSVPAPPNGQFNAGCYFVDLVVKIDGSRTFGIGQAAETDIAQPVHRGSARVVQIGQPFEVDLASSGLRYVDIISDKMATLKSIAIPSHVAADIIVDKTIPTIKVAL